MVYLLGLGTRLSPDLCWSEAQAAARLPVGMWHREVLWDWALDLWDQILSQVVVRVELNYKTLSWYLENQRIGWCGNKAHTSGVKHEVLRVVIREVCRLKTVNLYTLIIYVLFFHVPGNHWSAFGHYRLVYKILNLNKWNCTICRYYRNGQKIHENMFNIFSHQ